MDGHDADSSKQSTADMTAFVENLLQTMQTRFQTMSQSIISKNILATRLVLCLLNFEFCVFERPVSILMINSINSRVIIEKMLDEMGNRIDELEKSINDLRTEMGQEGSPSPSAPLKIDEPKSTDDSA